MEATLKRIAELKAQKAKISDEIMKLADEVTAQVKAALGSGKPRKPRAPKQLSLVKP